MFHDNTKVKATFQAIRGDVFNLAGPHNSTNRQLLMLAMTGEKLPKAKCGVTALEKEALVRTKATGGWPAERERNVYAAIQATR